MLKLLKLVIVASFLLTSVAFVFQQEPVTTKSGSKVSTVVIDAGHGGKDPGTRGRHTKEKDVALKVALELGRKIKEETPDVKVLYTRSTDVFIELGERSAFANRNNADLFISIHCNATPRSRTVRGTETFVMGLHKTEGNLEVAKRENSVILQETNYKQKYKGFDPDSPLAHIMLANYQSAFISSSLRFADLIERKFQSISERDSRGVKQAGFLVLWRCAMPSVLIETGFLSSPDEEDYLSSDEGQEEVAKCIHSAFMAYKKDMDR
ncbi:N-acetylmuramoyl-L-alanine amidase family protein [Dyadobacter fermentans]|uniref:N-acetylmuramoyl-L-alanine amidase n=1 Tax=Dyadobacter fermentans (strain ATCC 700827 / DSM 18053 / CIP 107007 / KCTC 52180 / NS114) TaxID=471854 RepID=C6VV17_DYAFD|nr:N-acetylmuramoyl-L-alanine amidase [Dyadobacter fermentans]ACT94840.1 N-acetylmuramoyl-L-alanine amidase [Dyadobacter fermentans DSM 18053]